MRDREKRPLIPVSDAMLTAAEIAKFVLLTRAYTEAEAVNLAVAAYKEQYSEPVDSNAAIRWYINQANIERKHELQELIRGADFVLVDNDLLIEFVKRLIEVGAINKKLVPDWLK